MSATRSLLSMLALVCLAILAGCTVPAQIVWSPDGSTAAYRVKDKAYLIDATGKVDATLGDSAGGFAWSGDSKTLYFATTSDQIPTDLSPIHLDWESDRLRPSPTTSPMAKTSIEISARVDGKVTALAKFASGPVLYMLLSPDQKWLAMVSAMPTSDTFAVHVYSLAEKKLYLLSDFAGFGLCFTGPNRLAYIEPDRTADKMDAVTGKIVEVTLQPGAKLDRKAIVDVIPSQTPFIAPLGENLLITSIARNFPGKPLTSDDPMVCKLFMWTRANGGMVAMADDIGPLFAVAPDGGRIMIEKITPSTDTTPAKHALMIIRANGSDGVVLRDLSAHDEFALWPAWHGNNEITFTSPDEPKPVSVENEEHLRYDLVLYKLGDKGDLQPIRTLSESWNASMKPYLRIGTPASGPITSTTRP